MAFSFDIVKGVTIYSSHVRFEIILSGLALKDVRVISPYSLFLIFFQTFFYFSNALRYPLYMLKSNVLSRGMKVFFSLLLAFFYFWVYYFSFCASEEIILRKLVLQNSSVFWDSKDNLYPLSFINFCIH